MTTGRYQFLVDSTLPYIQKTVEVTGTTPVRYYLAAGTHELKIAQDTTSGTNWLVAIVATGETQDILPYRKSGGNLGGTGNIFRQEWLPLNVAAGAAANFQLTLTGILTDQLTAYLYHDGTAVYTTPVVYGGETFWWTTNLPSEVSQVKLVANAGNTKPLSYNLTIHSIPAIAYNAPYTWGGLSKGQPTLGGNAEVELQMPVNGIYHVVMNIPYGFASVNITQPAAGNLAMTRQSRTEFDIPLDEGGHLFKVQQSSAYITTTWEITVSLKTSLVPQVTGVDQVSVTNGVTQTVIISGTNFQPGAVVKIDDITLDCVTWLDSTRLEIQLPAGTPAGVYTITVTNPDEETAVLADALTVVLSSNSQFVYLPLVLK